MAAFGRHIKFLADDRLYPGGSGALVKINSTEHGTMIGEGEGRELEIGSVPGQVGDTARSVKEAVGCVNVEMNEFGVLHKISSGFCVLCFEFIELFAQDRLDNVSGRDHPDEFFILFNEQVPYAQAEKLVHQDMAGIRMPGIMKL